MSVAYWSPSLIIVVIPIQVGPQSVSFPSSHVFEGVKCYSQFYLFFSVCYLQLHTI